MKITESLSAYILIIPCTKKKSQRGKKSIVGKLFEKGTKDKRKERGGGRSEKKRAWRNGPLAGSVENSLANSKEKSRNSGGRQLRILLPRQQ